MFLHLYMDLCYMAVCLCWVTKRNKTILKTSLKAGHLKLVNVPPAAWYFQLHWQKYEHFLEIGSKQAFLLKSYITKPPQKNPQNSSISPTKSYLIKSYDRNITPVWRSVTGTVQLDNAPQYYVDCSTGGNESHFCPTFWCFDAAPQTGMKKTGH